MKFSRYCVVPNTATTVTTVTTVTASSCLFFVVFVVFVLFFFFAAYNAAAFGGEEGRGRVMRRSSVFQVCSL